MSVSNPMFGEQTFKIGLFSANCSGGLAVTTVPEQWAAEWDEIVELTCLAEDGGLEFILPVAKWKGYGGESDILGRSYETFTHGAALAALTTKMTIFVTVHVPLVHPTYAAKSLATIDHISRGRVGLNMVCGWNQDEFDLFGVAVDPDRRYEQGLEWYRLLMKLYDGGPEFSWNGDFYSGQHMHTNPLPIQRPRPITMSAGVSPQSQEFAAVTSDFLFTAVAALKNAPSLIGDMKSYAGKFERDIGVYTMSHVVCRETRKEAEEYFYFFAEECADRDALSYYEAKKGVKMANADRGGSVSPANRLPGQVYTGSYPGAYPLVGAPDDVAREIIHMHELGLDVMTIAFVNYLDELPFFLEAVLPRLEAAGIRLPVGKIP